jgi:hypothetical protein
VPVREVAAVEGGIGNRAKHGDIISVILHKYKWGRSLDIEKGAQPGMAVPP